VTAIVVAVGIGALWATGVIDPLAPFRKEPPSLKGMVQIPVSAVVIPAYTKITRDHFWNPKTGSFATLTVRQEQVSQEMIGTMSQIIGRVMDHDKPVGYAFTESDFLPKGTRPGLVAGIPPGKRAMRIPLEKIPGLAGLLPGDRFDLVSTLPIDIGGAGIAGGGIYGKQLEVQARMANLQKQATVRVVVQNGNIVQPVTTRQVPVANSTLTSGLIVRTKPVQEVVIAVGPGEVAHLTEALAVGADVACIPRSGRPEDPRDSVTPESSPISPYGGVVQRPTAGAASGSSPGSPASTAYGAGFAPIETIAGSKREIIAAPVKH
jgi:Flp pilus assembly protein CpaB